MSNAYILKYQGQLNWFLKVLKFYLKMIVNLEFIIALKFLFPLPSLSFFLLILVTSCSTLYSFHSKLKYQEQDKQKAHLHSCFLYLGEVSFITFFFLWLDPTHSQIQLNDPILVPNKWVAQVSASTQF